MGFDRTKFKKKTKGKVTTASLESTSAATIPASRVKVQVAKPRSKAKKNTAVASDPKVVEDVVMPNENGVDGFEEIQADYKANGYEGQGDDWTTPPEVGTHEESELPDVITTEIADVNNDVVESEPLPIRENVTNPTALPSKGVVEAIRKQSVGSTPLPDNVSQKLENAEAKNDTGNNVALRNDSDGFAIQADPNAIQPEVANETEAVNQALPQPTSQVNKEDGIAKDANGLEEYIAATINPIDYSEARKRIEELYRFDETQSSVRQYLATHERPKKISERAKRWGAITAAIGDVLLSIGDMIGANGGLVAKRNTSAYGEWMKSYNAEKARFEKEDANYRMGLLKAKAEDDKYKANLTNAKAKALSAIDMAEAKSMFDTDKSNAQAYAEAYNKGVRDRNAQKAWEDKEDTRHRNRKELRSIHQAKSGGGGTRGNKPTQWQYEKGVREKAMRLGIPTVEKDAVTGKTKARPIAAIEAELNKKG